MENETGIIKENPKRTVKDTLFKGFFADNKKAFIDLYKVASGKELREEDISPYSLNSDIVNRSLYNDVSYITKDNRLIILVEHQSTANKNMAEREFLYYAALAYQFLKENDLELSSLKKIDIPMPEFYVAYNGKEKYDTDSLNFENEFIKVSVKLLDANLRNLLGQVEVDKNNALLGYAYFIDELEKKRKTNYKKSSSKLKKVSRNL